MEKNENSKMIKIYPNYLDKGLKYSEGRKVAVSLSSTNPLIEEIGNIVSSLKLDYKVEPQVRELIKDYSETSP